MTRQIKQVALEVIQAILPLTLAVVVLQFALIKMPTVLFLQFLAGIVMIMIGITVFLLGVRLGVLPLGEAVGAELPRHGSLLFILGVAFGLGFAVTMAEPGVIILADQLSVVTEEVFWNTALVYVIAAGVGIFTCIALLRIILGVSIRLVLVASYTLILILFFFVPDQLLPVAFDAGGATTGPLTVPIILALGLGFSTVLARRSSLSDGFGLIGLAALGPIIGVMLIGIFI